ncbi:type II secretion system minor pseudopilin GspK [Rheinheimera soli]|uniref:type II secretion system minor pseudopilin GspK n=1 Tax=Rheinheimera soli TaxID=443616 RepID=UPI001E60AA2D|nr:type II secretion system minor pseudopilin GspK [Rheinheimera soli]
MRRQAGVALVVVMMIVALVVVIAVGMSGRLQLQLQRQLNLQQQQQAYWYGIAAEQASIQLLKSTVAGKDNVNLSQDWALLGATFPVDNGSITGKLIDLQSCFNLNNLQRPAEQRQIGTGQTTSQKAFQRLLELKATDLSMPAEYLTARISDWLDADSLLQTAGGAEQDDYAGLQMPFYTANSLMGSTSELRVMLDLTPADYELVRPWVCVIPKNSTSKLNLNTITVENAALLAAYIPELDEGAASDLIGSRPEEGFATIDEVWASPQLANISVTDEVKAMMTINSNYFVLETTVTYMDTIFNLASVLVIDEQQKVKVIARRFGGQW